MIMLFFFHLLSNFYSKTKFMFKDGNPFFLINLNPMIPFESNLNSKYKT